MPLTKVTYAPLSQVESTNLNDIQDKVKAVVDDRDYDVNPSVFEITAGAPTWTGAGGLVLAPGDTVEYTLPGEENGTWNGVKVRHLELANGEITIKGFSRESVSATTNISDTQVIGTDIVPFTALWLTRVSVTVAPQAYNADALWILEIDNSGTGNAIVHKVMLSMDID